MNFDWSDLGSTPVVAAAVGLGVWYIQSRIETLRRAQERIHDDRRKVYAEILEPLIRAFAGVKNPKENQKAIAQVASFDYRRAAFEFSLLGSDEVVRAFNAMMQYLYTASEGRGEEADPKEFMRHWGAFLLEVRKSVGNPDTKLTSTDMLKPHIKDIESLLGS